MFGISLEHLLILLVAGFFILGPRRLPEAAAWLGRTTRQVREYVNGAREQIRSELGPEFEELRKPLQDLNSLRRVNPKLMVGSYLLDDTGNPVGGSNGAVQGVPADPSQASQPPQPDQPPTVSRRPAADPDSHQTAAATSPESGRNVP